MSAPPSVTQRLACVSIVLGIVGACELGPPITSPPPAPRRVPQCEDGDPALLLETPENPFAAEVFTVAQERLVVFAQTSGPPQNGSLVIATDFCGQDQVTIAEDVSVVHVVSNGALVGLACSFGEALLLDPLDGEAPRPIATGLDCSSMCFMETLNGVAFCRADATDLSRGDVVLHPDVLVPGADLIVLAEDVQMGDVRPSPLGDAIFATDRGGSLLRIPVDGAAISSIAAAVGRFEISPDGEHVLWVDKNADAAGERAAFVHNLTTGTDTYVFHAHSIEGIAFLGDTHVATLLDTGGLGLVVRVADGSLVEVPSHAQAELLADGSVIMSRATQLGMMGMMYERWDPGTGNLRPLFLGPPNIYELSMKAHGDAWIVLVPASPSDGTLWRIPLPDGDVEKIADGVGRSYWQLVDDAMVVTTREDDDQTFSLQQIDLTTGERETLALGLAPPPTTPRAFSDAGFAVYTTSDRARRRVWSISLQR